MTNIFRRNSIMKFIPAGVVVLAALMCLFLIPLHTETPLGVMICSPDITAVFAGATVNDEDVAEDDLLTRTVILEDIGVLPISTAITAYHAFSNGDILASFDTTVSLPGNITAGPGDVVRFDGVDYTIEFDASANGLPAGLITDAVSVTNDGYLLLSFDVTVLLDGIAIDDEDLVSFGGTGFSLIFDGANSGVPTALDLDGAHYLTGNGNLMLSFDGSGTMDVVTFDDEDVLESNPATGSWKLAYDGSAQHSAWAAADLDALQTFILGDLDRDGCVDRANLNIILADIRGPGPHNPSYDLNGDGEVNISDARKLITLFTNPRGSPC